MRDAALDPLRQSGRAPRRPRPSGAPPLDGVAGEGLSPRVVKPVARDNGPTSAAIAAQRLGGGRAAARRRDAPGLVARLRERLPHIRPFKVLTVSAFSIALVGIVANAMVFQRGHHPAPLFGLGRSIDGQPATPPQSVAERPAPVTSPAVDRTGTGTVAPAASAPAAVDPAPRPVEPAPRSAPAVHHAAKTRDPDAIDSLLSSAAPAAAHPRPGHVAVKGAAKGDAAIKAAPTSASAAPADKAPARHADHAAKSAVGAPSLARTDPKHHVKAVTGAHPRPHAPSTSGSAAAEARAELAPKAGSKTQ